MSVQDEALFRAFQSNLLSLISHELRTPLTGILNALGALEEGTQTAEFSQADWVRMARQNAQRLNQTLGTLLDLAALESGTFHVRLREVGLSCLVQSRIQQFQSWMKDRKLEVETEAESSFSLVPLLADPQKLGRAVDLCLEVLISRAQPESQLKVRISSTWIEFQMALIPGSEVAWDQMWNQSLAGSESGVISPYSAFAGVLQSEQAFLTRAEEGLGSEFMLVHEITRLHHGKMTSKRDDRQITLRIELPELSSEEGLRLVLNSRVYQISTEPGSVSLVLIRIPEAVTPEDFQKQLRQSLFRATDAVYALPTLQRIALVLNDCNREDAPKLIARISRTLGLELSFGTAHCPSDGLDPAVLLELAEKRLVSG